MKKYIFNIIIFLIMIILNTTIANTNNNKIEFSLAKKLFLQKKYNKANILFKNIISHNTIYEKYSIKSKFYLILIKRLKHKKYIKTTVKIFLQYLIKKDITLKYINNARFLYSMTLLNSKTNIILKKIHSHINIRNSIIELYVIFKKINRIKKQKYEKKTTCWEYYTNIYNKKKILKESEYYIKNNLLLSALQKIKMKKNFSLYDKEDYKQLYLTIKICNELFLTKISQKILYNFKKNML